MQRFYRVLTFSGIIGTLVFSTLVPIANAGTAGRQNTALALTGIAVYSALHGNNTTAIVAGLGAAQAWNSYEDSRKRYSRQRTRSYRYSPSRTSRGDAYRRYQRRGDVYYTSNQRGNAYRSDNRRGNAYGHYKQRGKAYGRSKNRGNAYGHYKQQRDRNDD